MPVKYDPAVIRYEVQKLYDAAAGLIVVGGVAGALIGATIGAAASFVLARGALAPGAWFGAFVGTAFGAAAGSNSARRYRLQGQQLMVQVAIEENTRWLVERR